MIYHTLHRLWRLLPREQRQAFFYALTNRMAPTPDRVPPPAAAELVTVAGLLSTTTGLGEGARLELRAFQDLGLETRAIDLSAAFDQVDLPGGPPVMAPPPQPEEGGSLIVHINSPYLPFALWHMKAASLRGRKVIGYWAWELPRVPPSWRRGLPFVHEIWVPSRFTADAIAAETRLPVRVVPHPLPPPAPAPLTRGDMGLPDDAFIAMAFFHMGSSFTRKNPLAVIRAFRTAFGDDPSRILLLKVVDSTVAPWARQLLAEAVADAPNIRLVEHRMTGAEVAGLLRLANVVMSLHRAEGFGLVPAEAMLLGKPVIATGWSGNLDFMDSDNSLLVGHRLIPVDDPQGTYNVAGQYWADPDTDEAAAHLRRLAADPDLAARIGARAAAAAAHSFGLVHWRTTVAEGLGLAPAP